MTETDAAQAQATQSVLLAIEQLISGERTTAEFRDEMLNVVYEHAEVANAVRGLIDDYGRRGLIPEQIHRLLSRDIDKATSEEMPTTPTEFPYHRDATGAFGEQTIGVLDDLPSEGEVRPEAGDAKPQEESIGIGVLLRDRFEIIGRASGGSMGVVYKAIDRRLAEMTGGEPTVAIKVLAPAYSGNKSAVRALQQEAAKGRYLNHPNIVRFLDVDRSDGQVFLVMEWLEGRSLSEVLSEKPGSLLPRQQALEVIADVGDALQHAHGVGVTHADVKPGNVMLLDDGTVKLLDFGIARARGNTDAEASDADDSFLQAATPAFASPAVLKGAPAKPIDDVFSLACLAYRLFGGRRVFRDRTALDALEQGNKAPRIPDLESRLWRALEHALILDEGERTSDVETFLQELGIRHSTRKKPRWLFYAGVAAALAGLSVVAVMSPRWRGIAPLDPVVPVASTPAAMDTPVNGAVIEPIPIPEFLVTSAQWVSESDQTASASLILPFADDVVQPVVRIVEDSGLTTVSLYMPDVAGPTSLRLRRRGVSESMRRVLGEHVRIATPQPFVFEPSQTKVSIAIENLPDAIVEPDATVTYDIVRVADKLVVGSFALRLIDDDRARLLPSLPVDTVSFAQDNIEVTEDSGATTLTLWRLNPGSDALDVTLDVVGMSAIDDEDFVSPMPPIVRFEPEQTVATVFIPIVSDAEAEDVELFRVTLSDQQSIEDINSNVTVRILDTL